MLHPHGRPASRSSSSACAMVAVASESPSKRARLDTLSSEQQRVLEAVLALSSGQGALVTGAAGTGKSALLASLVARLPSSAAVVASTGCAAAALPNGGGQGTLHAWAGVGLGTGSPQQLLAVVEANSAAAGRWRAVSHLVVDEASMLPAKLLDALDFVGRCVRGRVDEPFGGISLLLVGDFAQLPPPAGQLCFRAAVWPSAISHVLVLSRPMRQDGDPAFFKALSELRVGNLSAQALALLNSRARALPSAQQQQHDIVPTRLRAKRAAVAACNRDMLGQLPRGGGVLFRAQDKGADRAALEDLQAPAELALKAGAQVMLVRSLAHKHGRQLVNGARGVVVGFDAAQSSFPIVKFLCGARFTVTPMEFSVERGGREVAWRKQLPLALAWAVTIHKAQGMTLDCVEVDVEEVFAAGQTYVALSRCRSLDGLYLTRPIEMRHVKMNPEVVEFIKKHEIMPAPAAAPVVKRLQGMSFVLQGRFQTLTKARMIELIRENGGTVVSASAAGENATHAIVGTVKDASQVSSNKNVQVWSEEELLVKLGGGAVSRKSQVILQPPEIIELL